jgi:probable HAF family extracellular repeat protein
MIDLGFYGEAYRVNNHAEVVGQLSVPPHAFLWKNGSLFDLGTLGGDGVSGADGINNQGEVVGQAAGPNILHAFAWTARGGMRDLGTLDGNPASTSGANAINDLGQIVGASYSHAFGTTHAAYFSRQGVIDLGTLGGLSDAHALNNLGQVVGDSYTSDGDHAFLTDLQGGPMVDLNTLIPPDSGWSRLFTADGINDAGQIVGTGQLPGYDIIHAYLLTPQNSPAPTFVTVGTASGEFRATVWDIHFPERQAVDLRTLPQMIENCGGSPLPSPTSLVSQSMTVLAPPAGREPEGEGWLDPLADVLIR